MTEPASEGVDDILCLECNEKFDKLTAEQQDLSIHQIRLILGITPCNR